MSRRSKEISIFNLSMLDVIFGALGAFMILFMMVVLELRPPAKPCAVCKTCEKCKVCPKCERNAFFVFWIVWNKIPRTDIDLYVISPNGKYCGYTKKRVRSNPGMDLLWDYKVGGLGNKETILVPRTIPGRWKIAYHHFAGSTVSVKGFMKGSSGLSKRIRPIRVSKFPYHRRGRYSPGKVILEFDVTAGGQFRNFRQR